MRRLIAFTNDDGSPIFVDPTHVIATSREGKHTIMLLDVVGMSVTVTESPDTVGRRLNSALEAQS